jgi:ribose/xylose/arabinose/galactoside ABC-type transport system permease subunit
MIAREFDLSIVGMMSLAGCIAVMTGGSFPLLGLALAIATGCVAGAFQGAIVMWLDISSVGVTLGGLLISGGLAYVLTDNSSIAYPRMDVAMLVNAPIGGVLSLRNIAAVVLFVIATVVFDWTRIGRDVVATGSDRRAALVAGVSVRGVVIGVFALSGTLAAVSGALLSYSLAAASPVALVDALVPATAAAIIGGVSLSGGKGNPASIAGGVLVLCVLQSALTAIGVPPLVHDLVTGAVLLTVALLDASALEERLYAFRRRALARRSRRADDTRGARD